MLGESQASVRRAAKARKEERVKRLAKKLREESPSRASRKVGIDATKGVVEEATAAAGVAELPLTSFSFQQRHGKLDFRAIARVDLDALVRDVDVDTLQRFVR